MSNFTIPNFDYLLDPPDDGEPGPTREEQEDELAHEAYFEYLEALESRGSTEPALSFEEFCARVKSASVTTLPAPPEAADVAEDDIPF